MLRRPSTRRKSAQQEISINLVPVRFLLFVISTGVLAAMVARELMKVF